METQDSKATPPVESAKASGVFASLIDANFKKHVIGDGETSHTIETALVSSMFTATALIQTSTGSIITVLKKDVDDVLEYLKTVVAVGPSVICSLEDGRAVAFPSKEIDGIVEGLEFIQSEMALEVVPDVPDTAAVEGESVTIRTSPSESGGSTSDLDGDKAPVSTDSEKPATIAESEKPAATEPGDTPASETSEREKVLAEAAA